MKIDGLNKALGNPQANEVRNRPANNAGNSRAPGGGTEVRLSSLSSSLQKAEATIGETPMVDRARVAEIRQAISEGRFKIDANRIADGLLSSVRDLLAEGGRA